MHWIMRLALHWLSLSLGVRVAFYFFWHLPYTQHTCREKYFWLFINSSYCLYLWDLSNLPIYFSDFIHWLRKFSITWYQHHISLSAHVIMFYNLKNVTVIISFIFDGFLAILKSKLNIPDINNTSIEC